MALSQQQLRDNNVQFDSVINKLNEINRDAFMVRYPFAACFDDNGEDHILTKILFVNYLDSTQIKNINIPTLQNYISSVLIEGDFVVLHQGIFDEHGKLNDRYFDIVNNIAIGHGIIGAGNRNEDNLTSFASKFCGHHNQNSPFWDNQVSVFVKYLNYRHRYRNYREYVESIIALRNDYNLVDYSLREIEYAMWEITDDVINGRFLN